MIGSDLVLHVARVHLTLSVRRKERGYRHVLALKYEDLKFLKTFFYFIWNQFG